MQVIWPHMLERASRIGRPSRTQAPIKIDGGSSVSGGPPLLCVFGAQRDQVAEGMPCVADLHEGDRLSDLCAAALGASLTATMWALFGFAYPSSPIPIAMNVLPARLEREAGQPRPPAHRHL
jgi:hypothetical protein